MSRRHRAQACTSQGERLPDFNEPITPDASRRVTQSDSVDLESVLAMELRAMQAVGDPDDVLPEHSVCGQRIDDHHYLVT